MDNQKRKFSLNKPYVVEKLKTIVTCFQSFLPEKHLIVKQITTKNTLSLSLARLINLTQVMWGLLGCMIKVISRASYTKERNEKRNGGIKNDEKRNETR